MAGAGGMGMPDRGWHEDPLERGKWRWHDGASWTDHTASGNVAPVRPPDLDLVENSPLPNAAPDGITRPTQGWHEDPLERDAWRWHDGTRWTENTATGSEPPEPLPTGTTDQSAPLPSHPEATVVGVRVVGVDTSGMRRLWHERRSVVLTAGVVLAAVVVAMLFSGSRTYTIEGSFGLFDSDGFRDAGLGCAGDGGFNDIGPGTPVRVRDGKGALIGSATLDTGVESGSLCLLSFTVPEVVKADYYEIEVGRRGSLGFSFSEMESSGWTVGFSLGES